MRCDSVGGFGVSALALVVAVLAMVPGVAVGDSMQAGASDRIGLAGTWAVSLDPDDVGVEQGWGRGGYAESIRLPGSSSSTAPNRSCFSTTPRMSSGPSPITGRRLNRLTPGRSSAARAPASAGTITTTVRGVIT